MLASFGLFGGACASTTTPNRGAVEFADVDADVDALAAIDAYIAKHPVDRSNAGWRLQVPHPPSVKFDPERQYYWALHTSEGLIKIRLFSDVAPRHPSSTIYLTRLGFYSDLAFHRIIPGFMMQGGDPLGDGRGGPGFRYGGELRNGKSHNGFGVVSMANAGRRTDGSQFFILFGPALHLNFKHTIFGLLREGFNTLDALEALADPNANNGVPPLETITIQSATITVE